MGGRANKLEPNHGWNGAGFAHGATDAMFLRKLFASRYTDTFDRPNHHTTAWQPPFPPLQFSLSNMKLWPLAAALRLIWAEEEALPCRNKQSSKVTYNKSMNIEYTDTGGIQRVN